ncbi:MAG: hypothetical protein ACP5QO_02600 [Clostridia bacterium]
MKTALAVLIAMASAVLGALAVVGTSQRPVRWSWLLGGVAAGALVAETATSLWIGPPGSPLEPGLDGLVMGLALAWLYGRRPKKPGS